MPSLVLRKEIRQARPASEVPRYGGMYGPDVTFLDLAVALGERNRQ
jgi:hypothetical protein